MSTVYLIGDSEKENLVKIGVTRGSIEKRLKKLQTGNGGELFIIHIFDTKHPFLIEKLLHQMFSSKNELNEWFRLSDEDILNFIHTCQTLEDRLVSVKDNHFLSKKIEADLFYR